MPGRGRILPIVFPKKLPTMTAQCKHPIVKIVAREDDIEFVECQTCGEVFDSAEYNDMALEEAEALEDAPMDE
jgi:Zn ribbon nucleic-acid-binding protein